MTYFAKYPVHDPKKMIQLSTGEDLCSMSFERLISIRKGNFKMMDTLGRSAHYAKKNKKSIDSLRVNNVQIDLEISRRMSLHKLTICGIEYRFNGRWETTGLDGEELHGDYWSRYTCNKHGPWRPSVETIALSSEETKQAISQGATITNDNDPLCEVSLTIIEMLNLDSLFGGDGS